MHRQGFIERHRRTRRYPQPPLRTVMTVSTAPSSGQPARPPNLPLRASLWRPGMRLLRRLHFPGKALLIAVSFSAPLALLLALYINGALLNHQVLRAERAGVQLFREALPVMQAAQQARALADRTKGGEKNLDDALTQAAQSLSKTMGTLQLTHAEYRHLLDTETHMHALQAAVDGQLNGNSSAEAVSSVEGTQAVLALMSHVGQTSSLVLDADERSFRLMEAVVMEMPELLTAASQISRLGADLLTRDDESRLRMLVDRLARLDVTLERMNRSFRRAEELMPGLEQHLASQATTQALRELHSLTRKEAVEGGGGIDAATFYRKADETVDETFALAQRALDQLDRVLIDRQQVQTHQDSLAAAAVLVSMLLAVYALVCFYFVTRSAYGVMTRHLVAMGEGDLREAPPPPLGRDEAAGLLQSMGQTHAALRQLLSGVSDSAGSLELASHEVNAAATDLARRTETAAATLQQQTASIEIMSNRASQAAHEANQASDVAQDNALQAERSGAVIGQVVQSMREIEKTSLRIHDIVGVIDSIAFQTNILALNAAVEAARAGESGRGFAVVASEVRGLAQRSADASREIRDLIQGSVQHVQQGTRVVNEAGQTIDGVVSNAREIKGRFTAIATAAAEQADSVAQISAAVRQLDQDTQQNAALVEETSAAAASLRHQAESMRQIVGVFSLS